MAGEKRIKTLASNRTALINSLLDKLEARVQTGQRELVKIMLSDFLEKMEQDETGNIKNTLANKRRFGMFDTVYNRFAKDNGLAVVQSIADGVTRIVDFNANYFSAFTTAAELGVINANVKQTISAWLGVSKRGNVEPNGYLDTLIKDATVKNQVKNLMLKSVVSQNGFFDTKKALQQFIEGTPDKLGALQRYYRNFAYDTFSVVDRTNGKIFADKLKFNYAIYEGGLIDTSRKFCEDHNGKVYSREEIAAFKPTEAIGPGYDPFTDLGGYGCRHHLNWIPDSVAFAMRPDLKGQQPAPPPEPKQVEAPQVDQNKFKPVKTKTEASRAAADLLGKKGFKIEKVTFDGKLNIEDINRYFEQLNNLTDEYDITTVSVSKTAIPLKFKSGARYGGYIKTKLFGGEIVEINLGSTIKSASRVNTPERSSLRYFSKTDEDKQHLSTLTHEFAHIIGTGSNANNPAASQNVRDFWHDLNKIRNEYTKEMGRLFQEGNQSEINKTFLGKYASTNSNEFMAEAFTEYKLSSDPSPFAVRVGKLIDKHFKIKK